MKITIASVLFVVLSLSILAQEARQYLNEYGKALPGPEGALCYRTIENKGTVYLIREYYTSNDQAKKEATATAISPSIEYEGTYKSYYENGTLEQEGEYKANDQTGLWKSYHENGQLSQEVMNESDKSIYRQVWNEAGTPLLVNGAGTFTRKTSRADQHIEILNSLLIGLYHIDEVSGDSIYTIVEKTAEYKGGMEALYKKVGKTLRYPADARRYGIEGKVFVEFVIEKTGSVRDVRVIKGLGGGLNEESVRVIETMTNWIPAKVKGKSVQQRMVLPIAFKLG
jgi:TonB family protein